MSAAAAATSKRPAPGAAPGGKKCARITFGSVYDYDRLQVLGEGTYGVVLKARHRRTGDAVAVKWVRGDGGAPDLRGVFREAACRGHPSIVGIRSVAADAVTGDVFLLTELVDGASLREEMAAAAAGPFSESETRAFMGQLLRGAARGHGAGLIHRDVKPENILIGPGGALKICDFGMATPARPAGTPYPEWWAGTLCSGPALGQGERCDRLGPRTVGGPAQNTMQ